MILIMSSVLNMEISQALNPLYAFPIVAVIVCAFIVYAFGFKSPVQPPSFDGIEEEKKISKKKKTKDTSKTKIVQNGKQNGSMSNKTQVNSSMKKKDAEKSVATDKLLVEKNATEKKVIKKAKQSNEKKVIHEKKRESFSQMQEDTGEDGWVQLISKKGRKNRKKDEMVTAECQTLIKPLKNSLIDKSDESAPPEEVSVKADILEKETPEKKVEMKNEEVEVVEQQDKVIIIEADSTVCDSSRGKMPVKDILKDEKINEETRNKSKKKKKKNAESVSKDDDCISPSELPAVQVAPEVTLLPQNASNNTSILTETFEVISGKVQENEPKELKSSNVVFDELEGLYPKEKEQKKKKRVRRDH